MSDLIPQLLASNRSWADSLNHTDASFFPSLAASQHPKILWLGCSDSRVPETTLLAGKPGDVFVHRNIANILHPGDLSSQSVILYAVEHLKVSHVIVCGHIGCGGVNAALDNKPLGLLDPWLLPLRQLRHRHHEALDALPTPSQKSDKLVELNVRQGVCTLKQNPAVIDAMRDRALKVHGMIYDVGTGHLRLLTPEEESEEDARRRVEAFGTSESSGRHSSAKAGHHL